jgi:hypothetical protein
MERLFWAFRSLWCGFEMKLPPRARTGYSLLIVICGSSAVNGAQVEDRLPAYLGWRAESPLMIDIRQASSLAAESGKLPDP